MFELDEKFFEEIGVNQMPESERSAFKSHIQEEVEVRVGERISDGMPMEKLEEFEMIIDGNADFVQSWIFGNAPNYRDDEIYQAFVRQNGGAEGVNVITEYAGMKWLQLNRPDFAQIVQDVTSEMKTELRENISKIIG
ncbi:MAG: DUF5663 domain-containing protein [bacterium]|nr:DUF5663 domain-containing protein [bacterium]